MYDGCPGCPYKHYKQFYDYYGSFTYADDWALAALDGTTLTFAAPASLTFNFGDAHNSARKEAAKKGTAYMHVWMYAIRQFEDAIDDCLGCTANCTVHSWNKGVAFYTGSLEGTDQGGNSAGNLVYRLAEKRCAGQLRHLHPETIPWPSPYPILPPQPGAQTSAPALARAARAASRKSTMSSSGPTARWTRAATC